MFTFTKEILNRKVLNRQKTTVKKKNYEKLCSFFIHNFRKSLCNLQMFYHPVFRGKVLKPFVFNLFEVQSTVLVSSYPQGENVLI